MDMGEKRKAFSALDWAWSYTYICIYFFFQVFFEEIGNVFQELCISLGSGHNNMGTESTGQF